MQIDFKKVIPNAKAPIQSSSNAAGYDLYALLESDSLTICPGQTMMIHTGISVMIPLGYAGFIFARSGLSTKQGLRPANCVGVIDADYRGNIIVALYNDSAKAQTVKDGDRIAQLVVMPVLPLTFHEVDELARTERGTGGFGSTDIKK